MSTIATHALLALARQRLRDEVKRQLDAHSLHTIADSYVPRFEVALRYAFARGRQALKAMRTPDADKVAGVVRKALEEVLTPALLLRVVKAGGEQAVAKLGGLRAAGDVVGHEFHGNQWTGGIGDGHGTLVDKHGQSYQVRTSIDSSGRREFKVVAPGHEDAPQGAWTIASVTLRKDQNAASSVYVDGNYQRKGIASALYDYVEKSLGITMHPNAATTEDGTAFWKARKQRHAIAKLGGLRAAGDVVGHEFHGNQWTEGTSSIVESVSGNWVTFKSDAGTLEAKIENNILVVRESAVKEAERGKGEGKRLYESAIKYAQKQGLELQSSQAVSVSADRVWQSLKKRGFAVERAGSVELDTSLNKFYATKKLHGLEIRSGEPLWRSTWKTRELKKGDPTVKVTMSFNVKNQDTIDWADKHAAELIDGITETTRERLSNAIAEFFESGDHKELRAEVLDAVGDKERANLIARHETLLASNEGQRQAWDQAVDEGLLTGNEKRVWIVTPDDALCPLCEPLDGATAPLDGEYPDDGGDGPPLHVQCRCTEGLTV